MVRRGLSAFSWFGEDRARLRNLPRPALGLPRHAPPSRAIRCLPDLSVDARFHRRDVRADAVRCRHYRSDLARVRPATRAPRVAKPTQFTAPDIALPPADTARF